MKIFIVILLLFMKSVKQESALSFWHAFLPKLLTWSSNFKFLSIVIPRSTSFMFDSLEQLSITTVDGSPQLKRR